MEINNSFQNGQQSKDDYDIADSPMVNTTGQQQNFYARTALDFGKEYELSANTLQQHCLTEYREDNSMKADFNNPTYDVDKFSQSSSIYQRKSDPHNMMKNSIVVSDLRHSGIDSTGQANPSNLKKGVFELEQTPIKKASIFNDTQHLSSANVDYSEGRPNSGQIHRSGGTYRSHESINKVDSKRNSKKLTIDGFDDVLVANPSSAIPQYNSSINLANMQNSLKYQVPDSADEK